MTTSKAQAVNTAASAVHAGSLRPFGVSLGCTFALIDLIGVAFVVSHIGAIWHAFGGLLALIP